MIHSIADAASDPDHYEWIEGEAIAVVHIGLFAICSKGVKPQL
jgi:hypothetical protein